MKGLYRRDLSESEFLAITSSHPEIPIRNHVEPWVPHDGTLHLAKGVTSSGQPFWQILGPISMIQGLWAELFK